MKVRCIEKNIENMKLTYGKIYEVIKEDGIGYKIVDDLGREEFYCKERFEIVEEPRTYTAQDILLGNFKNGTEFKLGCLLIEVKEKNRYKELMYSDSGIVIGLTDKNLMAKFTLVKQDKQVTFEQAMKALENNKTVYCKVDDKTYTYNRKEDDLRALCSYEAGELSLKEILYGTWFVKGE